VASFGNTAREIAKVDNLFQSGAGSMYFGLAGTQGRMILTFAKPPDGAPVLEDDATVHTPEFEEREECTVSQQSAQLGTPTGIAV
jgi:hypothetical protein